MGSKIIVRESRNYNMFEPMTFNRDVVRTKELEQSFRKHGWIPAYPMHVVSKGDGKYIIKAGNHRFFVARKLDIPVLYVVCSDNSDIYSLETSTRNWTVNDYLASHCREENDEYLELRNYCLETGVPTGLALSMLMGQTAGSGNWGEKFKRGAFRINRSSNHAAIMKGLILLCKSCGVEFYNKNLFVQALSRVVFTEEVDLNRLKSKIKKFAHIITKRSSLDQYLEMFEELYNWKSASKIPVKFLACEAAKKRNAIGLNATKSDRQ